MEEDCFSSVKVSVESRCQSCQWIELDTNLSCIPNYMAFNLGAHVRLQTRKISSSQPFAVSKHCRVYDLSTGTVDALIGHEHAIRGLGVYEPSLIGYENYPKNTVTPTG